MIHKTQRLNYEKKIWDRCEKNEQDCALLIKEYNDNPFASLSGKNSRKIKNVLKKAQLYIEKYSTENRTVDQLMKDAEGNIELTRDLMIDPKKQNIYEVELESYLNGLITDFANALSLHNVNISIDIEKKPAGGKNAIYFHKDDIYDSHQLPEGRDNDIKSIDFVISLKVNFVKHCVYISHKYTDGDGGGQDHQYNEAISFVNYAKNINTTSHTSDGELEHRYFLSVVDGTRYDVN